MFKIPNIKSQISNPEAGITLLLSVMIMSALILIATTVAFLGVQQLRASRAHLITEPAFLAAKAGGEEGLWVAKRTGISNLPDCPASTPESVPAARAFLSYCKSFRGDTFNIVPGTPTTILLYNPNDPNGDEDISQFPYFTLSVSNTGTYAVNVNVARLDGTPISTYQVTPSNSSTVNLPQPAIGTEGRIQITLTSVGNTTADVTTDKGLPSNLNIASTACSSRSGVVNNCSSTSSEIYTRKIEVQLGN